MNAIFKKPNLLFLIVVRAPTFELLTFGNSFKRIPIEYKLLRALAEIMILPRAELSFLYLPHIKKNYLHSFNDKPSIIEKSNSNYTNHWHCMHKRHRDGDKPAYIYNKPNGETTQIWYRNGLEHRDGDNPSSIHNAKYVDGILVSYDRLEFRKNGVFHREGLPAIIDDDGSAQWYFHGELHRANGPAIEVVGEVPEYWLYGVQYTDLTFTTVKNT